MQKYVLGFLFSPSGEEVVLIEKIKPDWQKGRLNGVGGKVEPGENPFDAMCREFKEETGLEITTWEHFADMGSSALWEPIPNEWRCSVYSATSDEFFKVESVTDEQIGVYNFDDIVTNELDVLPNLRFLVPLARFFDGSGLDISYTR